MIEKEDKNPGGPFFYRIDLAFEITSNPLDDHRPDRVMTRERLYESLSKSIDPEIYEVYSVRLSLHQMLSNFNYLLCFEAFFKSEIGLPMSEYIKASELKEKIKAEMEAFFASQDLDYKQICIKPLL